MAAASSRCRPFPATHAPAASPASRPPPPKAAPTTTAKQPAHTCSAQMGSISDTMVRAPAAFMADAQPLPTSP